MNEEGGACMHACNWRDTHRYSCVAEVISTSIVDRLKWKPNSGTWQTVAISFVTRTPPSYDLKPLIAYYAKTLG